MTTAEREAQKALRRLWQSRVSPLMQTGISERLRKKWAAECRFHILKELDAAYSRGYSDGHEQQLQMRVRDAQERREGA